MQVKTRQVAKHEFRQERRGRPGRDTRYKRVSKRRLSLAWEVDQLAIESDGMYPLLTNDRELSDAEILKAHKRQPIIEKRLVDTLQLMKAS